MQVPAKELYNSDFRYKVILWRVEDKMTYQDIADRLETEGISISVDRLRRYFKFMKNLTNSEKPEDYGIVSVEEKKKLKDLHIEITTDKVSILKEMEEKIRILEESIDDLESSQYVVNENGEKIKQTDFKVEKTKADIIGRIKDIRQFMIDYFRSEDISTLLTEFSQEFVELVFKLFMPRINPVDKDELVMEFRSGMRGLLNKYNEKYEHTLPQNK